MAEKLRALLGELRLALDYPMLGSLPADKQRAMQDGFNPTVASIASGAAEFLAGFSLLFMLMNGVFTEYFLLSSSVFSQLVKLLLLSAVIEGLYRVFAVVLGKRQSAGSVFYTALEVFARVFSKLFVLLRAKAPKIKKLTLEEKKQKEIAENYRKFIEYGMDQPGLTYERQ
ncbi:MAG: hypothetical protein HYS53_01825 [Candidatus Aenigmarchaeota archaeon]|nr:hypothetical protein [Candidatus Aenigmarchaeota archaeon]